MDTIRTAILCAVTLLSIGCTVVNDPASIQSGMTERTDIQASRDIAISENQYNADVAARATEAQAEALARIEEAQAQERASIGVAQEQRIATVESARMQFQTQREWARVATIAIFAIGFVIVVLNLQRREWEPAPRQMSAREWSAIEAEARQMGILLQRGQGEIRFVDAETYEIVHVERN